MRAVEVLQATALPCASKLALQAGARVGPVSATTS